MTRQDQTRPDQTRQDKTRQDKTRQDKTRQDKTRQDKTRQDQTRPDETRRDETRRDQTRPDETRRDETRRDETRRDETRRDETRRDETRRDTLRYAKLRYAKLRYATTAPSPPITRAQRRHTTIRQPRYRPILRAQRIGHIANVRRRARSCANVRDIISKVGTNTVPPPDPPVKNKNLRYAFGNNANSILILITKILESHSIDESLLERWNGPVVRKPARRSTCSKTTAAATLRCFPRRQNTARLSSDLKRSSKGIR